jgi:hypothetical protein
LFQLTKVQHTAQVGAFTAFFLGAQQKNFFISLVFYRGSAKEGSIIFKTLVRIEKKAYTLRPKTEEILRFYKVLLRRRKDEHR